MRCVPAAQPYRSRHYAVQRACLRAPQNATAATVGNVTIEP